MRIFIIVLAIAFMLGLLVTLAIMAARVQRPAKRDENDAGWETIEPAQLEDGTPISAEMSRQQKAQQVLAGQVYHDTRAQIRTGRRIGLFILIGILLLAAVVLTPAIFVMLGQ